MKINEAILELKKFNPNAELTTTFSETIAFSWVCKDDADERKSEAEIVFIQPADIQDDEWRE